VGGIAMIKDVSSHGIILFDGVCNLCNQVVQFIIPRDPKQYYYFSAFQSNGGQLLLEQYSLSTSEINTVILIRKGRLYTKSTAVLLLVQKLTGLWPLLSVFIIIPRFIRDPIYDWIAKNRYKWFGQREVCMIPTPEIKLRFLD
jgi:predicted DCC family thiol-disulfide oxidoreductase YuxK